MSDKGEMSVVLGDGLEWLSAQTENAAMVYLDPPFGHGAFGNVVDAAWVESLVTAAWARCDGIVYLHGDPQLVLAMQHPVTPRGMIAWANGWVSGFKTRSTKFWPRQYQLIVGYARPDWRWRRVERERPVTYSRRGGGGGTGFVVSDFWTDIQPVDQCSFSQEKVGWKTQKPLALLDRLVRGSTDEGDLVLDPTCGSGTSLVAAIAAGRRARGADISPDAVALARSRVASLVAHDE